MTLSTIQSLQRNELSAAMLKAANPYEKRFKEKYDIFLFFSKNILYRLHKSTSTHMALPPEVTVSSQSDQSILSEMDVFKKVANSSILKVDMKQKYFTSLQAVYRKLTTPPSKIAKSLDTLCVGIEREGRILAEALNCLPPGRSLTPSGKRIPYEGGLLIGLRNAEPPNQKFEQCLILDGAIASGATIMAMMWQLQHTTKTFAVSSVHGPCEGLRAIVTFAHEIGLKVSLTVGHATAGLNEKFYAVNPADGTLVLGDIGDTISDLNNPSSTHK